MEIITSAVNEKIKQYNLLRTDKKYRRQCGLYVFEGLKLFWEAVNSGADIEQVFVTQDCLEKHKQLLSSGAAVTCIGDNAANKLKSTVNSEGIFTAAKIPVSIEPDLSQGYWLALDRIGDPGNMGSIIRTVEAIGFAGVIAGENCCDIWGEKVVRAAMGSSFRVPVVCGRNLPDLFGQLTDMTAIFAAVPDSSARSITEVDFPQSGIVVLGNETHGISRDVLEKCQHTITIDMLGNSESLGVTSAAAIVMWEIKRRSV